MKLFRLFLLAASIVTVGTMQAHDFWLIPDYSIRPGQVMKISAHSGDGFPTGDSSVDADRFARFELHGARGRTDVSGIRVLEKLTEAEVLVRNPGTYVLAVEIKPRPIELAAKDFNEYIAHEGLTEVIRKRAKDKKQDASGKELYAKFAKSIFRVGDTGDATALQPVGLKLEIVPLQDPAGVRLGEKLAVRVLFDGKPLPHAQVAAVTDAFPWRAAGDHDYLFVTRTSLEGIALIPLTGAGNWLLRMVHMIPAAPGKDQEWESFFSTLTFQVAAPKSFPLTVDSIMRGPDLVGSGISATRWSGDGKMLYFNWRRPGERESSTWTIPREGGEPRRLSREEARLAPPAGGELSRDRKKSLFVEEGNIVLMDLITNERTRLVSGASGVTSPRFTKDEKAVTFVRENNLFRLSLETAELSQLTDIRTTPPRQEPRLTESQQWVEDQQKELFEIIRERAANRERAEARRKERETRQPYHLPRQASVRGLQLSPNQDLVVFTQAEPADRAKDTIVPNYVTESGYAQDIPSRTKVGDALGRSRMGLISVETGGVVWIAAEPKERNLSLSNPLWSEDGAGLVVTGIAEDNKDVWVFLVDLKTGKTAVLDHLRDEAWVMGRVLASSMGWMPDQKSVYYVSEKHGYFQLYAAAIDGSGVRSLTSGKFEVFGPSLSHDKTRFYFTSSEVHPGERHFYSMPVTGGERTKITAMTGSNQALLSPDEKTLAIVYSSSNRPPELYLMENIPGAAARRVTLTPTEEWLSFPWVEPRIVTFKARDGAEVYARVYTPEMLKGPAPARGGKRTPAKRPAVIFVHGAGYLQNVHRYWSSYYREYMFHHVLMDKGFVVMDIDYRASSGYGRDWRTGIYRHMGGKDLEDNVDGAKWMVENLDVDPKRIGIYGGSYGGFITLMAMFTTPDVFAAGASLRPVTDWAHYNHGYTSNILNEPQGDAEAYKRSSPIYFAEGLKGALLICHGVVDVNVHFQDTVRLAQRLIELRKENWEVALYPVEDHGFQTADSWADQYRRILKLFEEHLGGGR